MSIKQTNKLAPTMRGQIEQGCGGTDQAQGRVQRLLQCRTGCFIYRMARSASFPAEPCLNRHVRPCKLLTLLIIRDRDRRQRQRRTCTL